MGPSPEPFPLGQRTLQENTSTQPVRLCSGQANLRFVRVGTLDKPDALKPDVHIYTRWKAKWLKLPKQMPSFRDYYNSSKLWPKASLGRRNAALGRNGCKATAGLSKTAN